MINNSTFGIEFESNIINRSGIIYTNFHTRDYPLNSGWNSQGDPTTAIEINSPIYHSINQAVNSIAKQFTRWNTEHSNYVFYAYNANKHVNEELTRSGQHIHIGVDITKNRRLSEEDKCLYAKHLRKIYPLLMAISAQPTPSERMLYSNYCCTLTDNEDNLPYYHDNHNQELNFSHLGTIEARVFDTNIPQCSLIEAWVMTKLLNHTRKNPDDAEHEDIKNFSKSEYDNLRFKAASQGFTTLPITMLLQRIKIMINAENLDNFEANSIRDIFYLMCKYALNPSDLYHILKPNKFNYFKMMFEQPNEYLQNLISLADSKFTSILTKMKSESEQITTFQQLINLSMEKPTNTFKLKAEIQKPIELQPSRDEIFTMLNNKQYSIRRINEIEELTTDEITEKISSLLNSAPREYVNTMTSNQILEANERFFTLTINHNDKTKLLGTIAFNVKTKEIMHLVVNKSYYRMGIGKTLLEYITDMCKETEFYPVKTFIREGNIPSENLFKKEGFILDNSKRESDTANCYVLNSMELI